MTDQRKTEKDWIGEFNEFLSAEPVRPPVKVNAALSKMISADLNPAASLVFLKVALIHLVIGTATLLVCPQFNVHLVPGMGLMSVFEKFGEIGCTLACGALFLSGSFLLASLVLRPEEVRVVRRTKLPQILGIGTLSIVAFLMVGASAVFAGAFIWIVGSMLGALATLEGGWLVRSKMRRLAFGYNEGLG
jgi:hypothetical protein